MTFDNAQFEAGIKQTITSLSELKEALQFNTAALNLGNVQDAVNGFKLDNISSAVEGLSSKFSALGVVGIRVLTNLTDSAINLGKRIYNISLGQIMTGGKNRAQKVADARFQLKGLFNDAEKVESAFESASKAVDGTAYGLDAAVSTASQLASSNVQLGEEMDTALRGVAGLAAMTNSSFEEMGQIFTKVAGNGRLMGMELTRISSHGVNAAATIAKYLNTTEAEVRDMVSKGKIDFNTFAQAMNSAFGDQAAKANETMTGALSNVRSALSRIGEIFYSGIIENKEFIALINDLRIAINSVKKSLEPLKAPFKTLVSSLSKLGSTILTTFDATKVTGDFINDLATAMNVMSGWIDRLSARINFFIEKSGIKEVAKVVEKTTEEVRKLTEKEQEIANDIFFNGMYGVGETRKKAIEEMKENYENIQDYVNELVAADGDAEVAMKAYMSSRTDAQEAMDAINKKNVKQAEEMTTALRPSRRMFEAINKVAEILKMTVENIHVILRSIGTAFNEVFNLKEFQDNGFDILETFIRLSANFKLTEKDGKKLTDIFRGIFSAIILLKDAFLLVGKVVLGIAVPTITFLANVLVTILSVIGSGINKIREFIKTEDKLGKATAAITGFFGKLFIRIKSFFSALASTDVLKNLLGAFLEVGKAIGEVIGPKLKAAKEGMAGFGDAMGEASGDRIKALVIIVTRLLNKLTAFLIKSKDKIAAVMGKVVDIFLYVVDKVIKFKDTVVSAVDGIIKSIAGIKDSFGDTEEAVDESTGGVTKKIEKNFGPIGTVISNILKVLGKFKGVAANIFNTFVDAIKNVTPAQAILFGVAGALTLAYTTLFLFFMQCKKFVASTAGWTTKITTAVTKISNCFDTINRRLMGEQILTKEQKLSQMKRSFIQIGLVIAVLALALSKLAKSDPKKLVIATAALSILMAIIYKFVETFAAYGAVTKDFDAVLKINGYLKSVTNAIIRLSAAMLLLSAVLMIVSYINTDKIFVKLLAFTVLLAEFVAACYLISKYTPDLFSSAEALIALSGAIAIMSVALGFLSLFGAKNIIAAATGISMVMMILGGILVIMNSLPGTFNVEPLAMLVLSLIPVAIALAIAARSADASAIASAGVMLSLMMAVLTGLTAALNSIAASATAAVGAGAVLVLALSMILVANALKVLLDGNYDWQKMLAAAGAMSIVMVILTGVLASLSAVAATGEGAIGILIAVAAIVSTLFSLSKSMLVVAISFKVMADAMSLLTKLNFKNFNTVIASFFKMVAVLLTMSVVLIPLGTSIAYFAVALTTLSIPLTVISVLVARILPLVTAFIKAFTAFAVAGAVIGKGLTAIAEGLGYVVENIILGFARGIVRAATVLVGSAPVLVAAVTAVATLIRTVIIEFFSGLVESVLSILDNLLSSIATHLPSILDSVAGIVYAIYDYLYNNVTKFATMGLSLITAFLSGMVDGLIKVAPTLVDKLVALAATLIGSFADALVSNGDILNSAIRSLINSLVYTLMNVLDALTNGALSKFMGWKGVMDELAAEQETLAAERQAKIAERGLKAEAEAVEDGADDVLDAYKKNGETTSEASRKWAQEHGYITGEEFSKAQAEGMKDGNDSAAVSDIFSGIADKSGSKEILDMFGANGNSGTTQYLNGLIEGAENPELTSKLSDTMQNLGQDYIITPTEDKLGIDSPSKVAKEIMGFFNLGLIQGTSLYRDKLGEATQETGDVISDNMKSSLSNVDEIMKSDLNYQPTITPVFKYDTSNWNGSLGIPVNDINVAAKNSLAIDANESALSTQIANLADKVDKLSTTDYSKMLEGVQINVDASTNVDGTTLRKTSANYTIQTIDDQQRAYIMSRGGRA